MTTKTACCWWDFVVKEESGDPRDLLIKFGKGWVYQLEKGEKTDYLHYQCRINLKTKTRNALKLLGEKALHIRPTHTDNIGQYYYVEKEETRVKGPWKHTDIYIPRQVREIETLLPWQGSVIEISKRWEPRKINVIIDTEGCTGKSTLAMYMLAHGLGRRVPYANNYKEIMRMIYCMPESKCYLIDLPRSLDKSAMGGLYAAIEDIKNGHVWDDRYEFKEKLMDSPAIWIFTNKEVDQTFLSKDRWIFWRINKSMLEALTL